MNQLVFVANVWRDTIFEAQVAAMVVSHQDRRLAASLSAYCDANHIHKRAVH